MDCESLKLPWFKLRNLHWISSLKILKIHDITWTRAPVRTPTSEPFRRSMAKQITTNTNISKSNRRATHLRATASGQHLNYYRRKKLLYLGFKRLLNLKHSFCNQFYEYFRFTRVRSTKKNSLYLTSNVFSLCELIGRKFAASA